MTETTPIPTRLDRTDADRVPGPARGLPWAAEDRRGALAPARDGAPHRRHHSLFEDLRN